MASRPRDLSFMAGAAATFFVHVGVIGAVWINGAHASHAPAGPGVFVDAQLVKFGKPRDLKFLPHKEGSQKKVAPPEHIKVAKSDTAPVVQRKPEDPPDKIDPLKKTHADQFKNTRDDDDRPPQVENNGALTGSKAGTASEAKGDPYILGLIDVIGTRWTVPTTIKDAELANLSADVCLTIDADGNLANFTFTRRSGNSQFDSSLEATLGTIKHVEPPPTRWAGAAARGRLCPTFSKQ